MSVSPPTSTEGHESTYYVAATCARCSRRFPATDEADRPPERFCEPCRGAMWSEEHDEEHHP